MLAIFVATSVNASQINNSCVVLLAIFHWGVMHGAMVWTNGSECIVEARIEPESSCWADVIIGRSFSRAACIGRSCIRGFG